MSKTTIDKDELELLRKIAETASDFLMCEKIPEFGEYFKTTADLEKKHLSVLIDAYEGFDEAREILARIKGEL